MKKRPLIFLGSGASIPHGIPGMDRIRASLRTLLRSGVKPNTNVADLLQLLNETGLEEAMSGAKIDQDVELRDRVAREIWELLTLYDLRLRDRVISGARLPLSRVYEYLFTSKNPDPIAVVTTNYDRVAEYAANAVGYQHDTTFGGSYLHFFPHDRAATNRTVKVMKVHGSLDWFEQQHNAGRHHVTIPVQSRIPEGFKPVIIAPGTKKTTQSSSQFPYKDVQTSADEALRKAAAYRFIGYGFTDSHVHYYVPDSLDSKPVVILAKKMTKQARAFLQAAYAKPSNVPCIAMEAIPEQECGTKLYSRDCPEGVEFPGSNLWELETFVTKFCGSW